MPKDASNQIPESPTEAYFKTRNNYAIISAILFAWEFLGFRWGDYLSNYISVSDESEEYVPIVAIALITYFAIRFTIEWMACGANVRKSLLRKIDFILAHIIGSLSIIAWIFSRLATQMGYSTVSIVLFGNIGISMLIVIVATDRKDILKLFILKLLYIFSLLAIVVYAIIYEEIAYSHVFKASLIVFPVALIFAIMVSYSALKVNELLGAWRDRYASGKSEIADKFRLSKEDDEKLRRFGLVRLAQLEELAADPAKIEQLCKQSGLQEDFLKPLVRRSAKGGKGHVDRSDAGGDQ